MRKAISHLKKSDPILSAIIEKVGPCKIAYGEPTFPSLAEAIVYQQLNGKAAVTISYIDDHLYILTVVKGRSQRLCFSLRKRLPQRQD